MPGAVSSTGSELEEGVGGALFFRMADATAETAVYAHRALKNSVEGGQVNTRQRSTSFCGQDVRNSVVIGDVLVGHANSAVDSSNRLDLAGVLSVVLELNLLELGTDSVVVVIGEGTECTDLVKVVSHGSLNLTI